MNIIFGLLIYIIFFVIIIPLKIYNNGYFNILTAYMPNLDLIGNILTWSGGPFKIWEKLYVLDPKDNIEFLSQTFINYLSLLGVTFLVARKTKLDNSISSGWSIAFVMLLMTYLLPGKIIYAIMDKLNNYFNNKNKTNIKHNKVVLIGTVITISVILFEAYLLDKYDKNLSKFALFIKNIPTKI